MRTACIAAFAAGCGGGLECGRGTVERDGKCVAIEEDGVGSNPDTIVVAGPRAFLSPATADLGEVGVGCGASTTFEVANGGDADLVIGAITLDDAAGTFVLEDTTTFPLTLAPGSVAMLGVDALPATPGTHAAQLLVLSNDPITAASVVSLEAVYGERTESFVADSDQVDVMLLIDHSCSMEADNVDDVAVGIPALLSALDGLGDWQIAEVTREDGCANGGVLDTSTPNVDQYLVDHAFDPGGGGAFSYLTEALLELGSLALSQTGPGGCNEGLLRPGAPLYVLVVSDEREQSGMGAGVWVTDFQSYVPDVVVSGVLDVNFFCGDGSGAGGYDDAVAATGGVTLDICTAWGPSMGDLVAGADLGGAATFVLAEPAVAPPTEVLVDGVATADFTFDAAANSVSLTVPVAEGAAVEITYPVAATCGP